MSKRTRKSRWARLLLARFLLWSLLGGCLACTSCVTGFLRGTWHGSPHAWDGRRGPVVPHDHFPADCSLCHAGGSWDKIRDDFVFDHLAATGVPLRGAHAGAECLRCHNDRGPVGVFAERGCAGCHEDIHQGQLGAECTLCHTENDWRPQGQFAEHNRTRFPLNGAHVAVACWRCHPGAQVGNFTRAPVECERCHQADLRRATSPNHLASGWTTDCQRCHQPISWQGAGFVHSAFPLVGAHGAVDCKACHAGGAFGKLAGDCASCHLDEYRVTTAPNHQTLAYPTTCESCHKPIAWQAATFSHTGITGDCAACHLSDYNRTTNPNHTAGKFPMTCESCHTPTAWQSATFSHTGITGDCAACHLSDYNRTTNPNHTAGNFPMTCESCHTPTAWQAATFSHTGITSDCAACHLPDYNKTTNPNHVATNFPTTCETCHAVNTWRGATFNHRFRINSGPHGGLSCQTCHQVPSNYNAVSCTHCHQHSQAKMNNKHASVPGYSWNSAACASCHPTGSE